MSGKTCRALYRVLSTASAVPTALNRRATTDRTLDDHRIFDNVKHRECITFSRDDRKTYHRAVRHTRRTAKHALRIALAMGVDI